MKEMLFEWVVNFSCPGLQVGEDIDSAKFSALARTRLGFSEEQEYRYAVSAKAGFTCFFYSTTCRSWQTKWKSIFNI